MYGSYVHMEVVDTEFADNHFPDDNGGNAYKCMRVGHQADLRYEGTDPDEYRHNYYKRTNTAEDDWTDLIGLTYALSDNTPDANYVEEVNRVLNVEQWLRFLAINTLLDNSETTLANGNGDDYYMYRGIVDPRFVLIQHDLDSIFGIGQNSGSVTASIFRATAIPAMDRFLKHPQFARQYYFHLRDLIETTFSAKQLDPFLDNLLGDFVPQATINQMKDFNAARNVYVLSVIPSEFTINTDLPYFYGYPKTIINSATIYGTADVIETGCVLVNGQLADWSQKDGDWDFNASMIFKPGINRIIVQTFDGPDGTGNELKRGFIDIWYDDGDISEIFGTLAADTTLDANSGPWHVMDDIIVPAGMTLTIEPGTTLFFDTGTGIIVQQGGRLIAEGTEYERIRLTRVPDSGSRWDGIQFDQTTEDNRLFYIDMEYGDGMNQAIKIDQAQLLIDNMTWTRTSKNVLEVSHPHLIVSNSVFPDQDNEEGIYGYGLTGNEYLIIEGNTFGRPSGYQDVIDFSDCHRPGPIIQIYNNVFLGGEDDGIDLDDADAHIEGNVFTNFLGGSGTGTANSIAADQGSQITVIRNIFYNNVNAVLLKGNAEMRAENNTFVGHTSSVINFYESGSTSGKGAYMDGNIFWDNADLYRNVGGQVELAVHHSILPSTMHYLGIGNIDANPLFIDPNTDFHLEPVSPAVGTGSWSLDIGAYVPRGAAIDDEPDELTYHTDATLSVGGPGITHYKYRLNNGPWSEELSVGVPIQLTSLLNRQSYTVYAIGKNSAGLWQSQDNPTASRTWTIDTSYSRLVINEVLAHTHGADPDLIELYYDGLASLDLSDMSLTDDPGDTRKFVFSSQTVSSTIMNPGDYLLLYGDLDTQLKDHLGFALYSEGEALYLYDKLANGGRLIDSVEFGPQLNSFSIGRVGSDSTWKLNKPTFGQANIVQQLGDSKTLKINEWLANGEVLFENDFIELFNPHTLPVDLSSLYLTDEPVTQPAKCQLGPLSFIAGQGFAVFIADGQNQPGHVDFRLSADGEIIGLFDAELNEIDKVIYGPQATDVSQARVPDGTDKFEFLELPTPGVANPSYGTTIVTVITLVPEDADKRVLVPTGDIGQEWRTELDFNDSTWDLCTGSPGGVGYERTSGYQDFISLDVKAQMYATNATCYIRIPFTVETDELTSFTELTLKMRDDDGFVAYLNGVELPKRNFDDTPAWNSHASYNHTDPAAVLFEYIDISEFISDLKPGENILAIHGMNTSITSADMLISAELDGTITTSAGDSPFASALELLDGLRVTELMYHATDGSNFDYIELQNISETILDLNGVRLSEGIEFTFPEMPLEADQYIVVASNLTAFRSAYGTSINVAGEYSGNLSNGGEEIILKLPWPLEAAILRFEYSDRWYPTTDGGGSSLVIYDPLAHPATWDQSESWQPALASPGK